VYTIHLGKKERKDAGLRIPVEETHRAQTSTWKVFASLAFCSREEDSFPEAGIRISAGGEKREGGRKKGGDRALN